jgi:hypothetical protein
MLEGLKTLLGAMHARRAQEEETTAQRYDALVGRVVEEQLAKIDTPEAVAALVAAVGKTTEQFADDVKVEAERRRLLPIVETIGDRKQAVADARKVLAESKVERERVEAAQGILVEKAESALAAAQGQLQAAYAAEKRIEALTPIQRQIADIAAQYRKTRDAWEQASADREEQERLGARANALEEQLRELRKRASDQRKGVVAAAPESTRAA